MAGKQMTYPQKRNILFLVFFVLFVGSIFIPLLATFLGAVALAIGGIQSVIHRAKAENKIDLDAESVNFPLAWVGLGGVMVAGGAVMPLVPAM